MLGYSCFGERDDRLLEAWRILQIITPQGQLSDLALFGGFSSGIEDETTLAFVNRVDDEGAIYQMSINLDEAEFDPDELMLTMAHEFSHVFTNLPSQLDRLTLPEECATWDNGEGCYRADSLMWEWIELFWDEGRIDEIDPWAAPSLFDGDVRCSLDPSFIGSYAATNPEEDFAESFSAFVNRVDDEGAIYQMSATPLAGAASSGSVACWPRGQSTGTNRTSAMPSPVSSKVA